MDRGDSRRGDVGSDDYVIGAFPFDGAAQAFQGQKR